MACYRSFMCETCLPNRGICYMGTIYQLYDSLQLASVLSKTIVSIIEKKNSRIECEHCTCKII